MADPHVSIVIPLWNGRAVIEACLQALRQSCRRAPFTSEVLIVDNASTDGSADWVAAHHPDVRLIRNPHNLGFSGGCNVGLRAARGDVLVLLNQDTEVRADWLAALVDGMEEPGIVGSLALLGDGRSIQHAGGRIEFPLGIAHHLGYGEALSPAWQRKRAVDFVTAAALAFAHTVFDDIGLLDEEFYPGYYEDADFCFRAREKGYSVRVIPDAQLIHREHGSFTDRLWTNWARLRGRLRFCLKHLPPQRFVAEFLPAEQVHRASVLAGDRHGRVARAYLEAIPMLLDLWRDRATDTQIRAGVTALQNLYAPAPWSISVDNSVDKVDVLGTNPGFHKQKPILTPSPLDRLPLFGLLWRRMRLALHRLVIFYVERRDSALEEVIRVQAEQIRELKAGSKEE